ncbi:MAG TPA: prepilin-type N-terminal cleavage/methylation domain-containing protein [Bryobacteraceae bacterium]|nr:prepilin-type N-terminal cleavage/methylation domain-containing protein [Bryobacteraceae bacterium]
MKHSTPLPLSGARAHRRAGVTLVEMLIVVALVGLMVSLAFPRISTGADSLRLIGAADSIASLFNAALTRAERRGEALEIAISPSAGRIQVRSSGGFERDYSLPEGVTVQAVLPPLPARTDGPRRFLVLPGGTVPAIAVELANRRGMRRLVRLDPITGVPHVDRVEGP